MSITTIVGLAIVGMLGCAGMILMSGVNGQPNQNKIKQPHTNTTYHPIAIADDGVVEMMAVKKINYKA